MSEQIDNPEVEDEAMDTRVIDPKERAEEERWIESDSGDGWDDGEEPVIPPRPRGRLLRPLPLALLAIAIAAAGFLGGIEAQKGSEGGSGGPALGGGEPPSFASKAGAGATAAATGAPSSGGTSEAAAGGTVTSVEGHTIYVKESDGTTVAVKIGDGATVTRDSNVSAKKIHPGDTVTVEGSKHGSTVRASSVAATESGVESIAGPGAAGGAGAASGEGAGSGAEAETSVESLFEE